MDMRSVVTRIVVAAVLVALLVPTSATALVARDGADAPAKVRQDRRAHPLGERAAALRRSAVAARLSGEAEGDVYEVEPGEFVELELEGTGMVWTVPGEFSDYPHNSIPEPDRAVDNSTIWTEDFGEAYYDEMLYARGEDVNSMAEYFLEMSSGRYTVDGDCADWVALPQDHTYYDDGTATNDTSENVWLFLADMLDGWYDMQIQAGKSPEEIEEYLAAFDSRDRYDWDEDGVFDEPDGYIDHFQSLHSGEGEEAGGGELGDEAIWSHSWYANYADIGKTGPSPEFLLGGVQIGDSGVWIGDYTIQPENGGVGVFAHEYTHDLGLPDLYDTVGGDNGTSFWTLMDSGSWLSSVDYDLGSAPGHQGPWEKLQLGWLDYVIATPGQTEELTLGPVQYNSTQPQALVVSLPDKFVEWDIGDPYAGGYFYYSGKGDNLRNQMTKAFTLPAGASLSAMVNYGIEEGYDYASVIVSTDDGATWDTVATNLSSSSVEDNGIDGFSDGWTPLTADLSAYEGDVLLGFSYITDGGVAEIGFMADEVAVTGAALDGAEDADAAWTFEGFKRTTGYESGSYANYYLAENRQFWGYDEALAKCYNWGFLKGKDAMANWAERFAYEQGLLVWYCDDSQVDNNTSVHPGTGFALPVDAHPKALTIGKSKQLWRNRVQTYDSPFGLTPTHTLPLHYNSRLVPIAGQAAQPVFDDAVPYNDPANPTGSVITPLGQGARIEVLGTQAAPDGGVYMGVRVTAP